MGGRQGQLGPQDLDDQGGLEPDVGHHAGRHPGRRVVPGQGGRDQPEVGADVVGPLQHRPAGPAAGVDQGQGVQDGRVAHPQPQRAGDGAGQVAGLQRGRPFQEAAEQLQLAALGAGPFGGRDLVQGLEHRPDLQGRWPRAGPTLGQQLLGGAAEVAALAQGGPDLLQGHAAAVGQGPGDQLVGQADLDAGEGGRDLPQAQVHDPGQDVVGGLAQQLGQPVDQGQTRADLFQVPVGGGHGVVQHGAPLAVGSPGEPTAEAGQPSRAGPACRP